MNDTVALHCFISHKKPCGLYIVVVVNVYKTMYSTCIKLAFVRGKNK